MRSKTRKSTLAALALAAIAVGSLGQANAGGRGHDHVYADSFGNLVIDSAAGYKRILVGEGSQAKDLAAYTQSGQPEVVYSDESERLASDESCYRAPYLVKGRSYMYGFDEGEIPFRGGPCE